MSNNLALPNKPLTIVADLYQYLDGLFEQDADSDALFAGGYLRGIFSLVATDFGDENQVISSVLVESVSTKLHQSKSELTPQDYVIVSNFWVMIQEHISTTD